MIKQMTVFMLSLLMFLLVVVEHTTLNAMPPAMDETRLPNDSRLYIDEKYY